MSDDDLDDLDDVLQQLKQASVKPKPNSAIGTSKLPNAEVASQDLENLWNELSGNVSDKENVASALPKDFESTIQAAVHRLQQSEKRAQTEERQTSTSTSDTKKDPLDALFSGLGGGEEGLEAVLEGMLGSIMTKDVLYEPLSELNNKYPTYLSSASNIPPEERKRYEAQAAVVKVIIGRFDAGETKSKEIEKLVEEMQELGNPPPEIMGPMQDGLDGFLGKDTEGCPVQ